MGLPVKNICSDCFKTGIDSGEWGFRPTTFVPVLFKPVLILENNGFSCNNVCSDLLKIGTGFSFSVGLKGLSRQEDNNSTGLSQQPVLILSYLVLVQTIKRS
jgi:hypothetical protein